MLIIKTNAQLQEYIPNAIKQVNGETPLIDKLKPFLEQTEQWLMDNITGEAALDDIATEEISNRWNIVSQLIVYDAFASAVPSLDLILTPNGFGIVSNSNIAPASKERVERLITSLINMRDKAIETLMNTLATDESWLETKQAEFFRTTLFPSLSLMRILSVTERRYENYCAIREQLISIEANISTAFIGDEQMSVFRKEIQTGDIPSAHKQVINVLQATVIRIYKDVTNVSELNRGTIPSHELRDVVNIIRNDETNFSEWHNSAVKQLFSPKIYENTKESKGFCF